MRRRCPSCATLLDPDLIFPNHGSLGACPREVFAKYQQWQLALERNPVEFLGRRCGVLLAQARARLGAHLGASGEDLVFVPNATTGANIVARSLSCAPKGSAFLHVRPGRQAETHATVVSWGYLAGVGGHSGFDAYTGTSGFERRLQWQGTRDLAAFLSVPAAIEFQARHDWPRLRARCHDQAVATLHAVTARKASCASRSMPTTRRPN